MAEYKFQKEVREKAEQYVASLLAFGYSARIQEHTFRDYTVKVFVDKSGQQIGDVIIYYKPSQSKHTLGTQEIKNKDTIPDLERIWHGGESSSEVIPQVGFRAYVDGSFLDGKIGYGAVILQDGKVLQEFSGCVSNEAESLMSMRQVGGEIQAVYQVLEWALTNKISEIEIFFDYEGLEFWANGSWRAKNPHTEKYQTYIAKSSIQIKWQKVKGHSGNRWNDRADELARQGASVEKSTPKDLLAELEDQSQSFVAFLSSMGIAAYFEKIYNGQHSRIIFTSAAGKNILDIYNTPKVHLDPKWHNFSDNALKETVKNHWSVFRQDETQHDKRILPSDALGDIEKHFESLRPYKDLKFDFIDLARIVEKIGAKENHPVPSTDEMRYSFELIEKTYIQLNGDGHGKH